MIFIFRTNVPDQSAIENLQPSLDELLPSSNWNFDLEDCDKILRIDSQIEIAKTTIDLLKNKGYNCEELPD